MSNKVLFTKSALPLILKAMDLSIDKEGFIIDGSNRIITSEKEQIHKDKFGGYKKGYGFVKSDLYSIMKFAESTMTKTKE